MKTLITGATGFVGAAVSRELLKKGHKVKALVRQSSVLNFSVLKIVWMDVAAPNPNNRGNAIIFAKFKSKPNRVKNDKENNKAAIKLIKTIKTFLKFLKVKNKNNVVKHIEIIIASLKDCIIVLPAS